MQRLKEGAQDHGGGTVVHDRAEAAAGPAVLSAPPPPPPRHHEHDRRPSSNTSSGGDTVVSSSDWMEQTLLMLPGYCSSGNGAISGMTKPPSLEMSLGRQGWQMEQCGGAGEFVEPSPSAKERTLLKCL